MTQAEFCRKYHVKPPFVSTCAKAGGVEPIGNVKGPKKIQPDYEEKDLLNAILAEYQRMYEEATNKAGEYRKRALEAKAIYSGIDR